VREYKFRAWNNETNVMVDVWQLSKHLYSNDSPALQPSVVKDNNKDCQSIIHDSSCFILMQFTGLSDKHGKEIYEGDIVDDGVSLPVTYRGVIEYSAERGCFFINRCHFGAGGYGMLDEDVRKDMEVIGNIYEHPDLLKGK
jgi:uncharacterized phage protein (TIGR01671 family)